MDVVATDASDVVTPSDAARDVGSDVAPDVAVDAATGLDPCTSATDYVTTPTTITFGPTFAYSPRCLTVHAGSSVTWSGDFASHPLMPATSRGTTPSPIMPTSTGTSATVMFPNAGLYPYYCNFHGSPTGAGMAGVVQVIP
jgi:plastocyanin